MASRALDVNHPSWGNNILEITATLHECPFLLAEIGQPFAEHFLHVWRVVSQVHWIRKPANCYVQVMLYSGDIWVIRGDSSG